MDTTDDKTMSAMLFPVTKRLVETLRVPAAAMSGVTVNMLLVPPPVELTDVTVYSKRFSLPFLKDAVAVAPLPSWLTIFNDGVNLYSVPGFTISKATTSPLPAGRGSMCAMTLASVLPPTSFQEYGTSSHVIGNSVDKETTAPTGMLGESFHLSVLTPLLMFPTGVPPYIFSSRSAVVEPMFGLKTACG